MGYTFTFGDIMRICTTLGLARVDKSMVWRGVGSDGKFRQTRIDSHGLGRPLATGTAHVIAKQLRFESLEEMYSYLQNL